MQYVTLGPGTSNGACIWYPNQAVCSPWNYWTSTDDDKINGGTILCGYENDARIRGWYATGSVWCGPLGPVDVGMGGYLKAHATYWSGDSSFLWHVEAST